MRIFVQGAFCDERRDLFFHHETGSISEQEKRRHNFHPWKIRSYQTPNWIMWIYEIIDFFSPLRAHFYSQNNSMPFLIREFWFDSTTNPNPSKRRYFRRATIVLSRRRRSIKRTQRHQIHFEFVSLSPGIRENQTPIQRKSNKLYKLPAYVCLKCTFTLFKLPLPN
jgi:hypothetical protein